MWSVKGNLEPQTLRVQPAPAVQSGSESGARTIRLGVFRRRRPMTYELRTHDAAMTMRTISCECHRATNRNIAKKPVETRRALILKKCAAEYRRKPATTCRQWHAVSTRAKLTKVGPNTWWAQCMAILRSSCAAWVSQSASILRFCLVPTVTNAEVCTYRHTLLLLLLLLLYTTLLLLLYYYYYY